ncbi:MAG: rod shape-determining protein MreC [Flavobacteriales bacterium]|nr:rod shape-determining protein MreC [Flavobacteriales bacterium]
MQQFFNFLVKYKYFLLFVLLEFFALLFTIQSHSFHQSVFVNSSNQFTGAILSKIDAFDSYLDLTSENKSLLEENTLLKNKLAHFNSLDSLQSPEFIELNDLNFKYISAKVIRNEFTKPNNYLTINKGEIDSVFNDIGAINEKGVIGIVNHSSKNYATLISILNQNLKINVKIKHSDFFGSLAWNGINYNVLQVIDIPRQANFKVGDTIVTGGQSTIFPEGIPVGSVLDIKTENDRYSKIDIKLFNDMSAIGHVYLIINPHKSEIKNLEDSNNE